MKRFDDLIADCLPYIKEEFPWDVDERLKSAQDTLLLDVSEQNEYAAMHIEGSLHVPRGILESACEYGYEETVKTLVEARNKNIVVVCRSGKRSVLAAYTMQLMGYNKVSSMKTGLRGWNDYELPLVDHDNKAVDMEVADAYFATLPNEDQLAPQVTSVDQV